MKLFIAITITKKKVMKAKSILIAVFTLLTFGSFGQTEKSELPETKNAVTDLTVETSNLDELRNFDWTMVKEMFQDNDKDQEITLAFTYLNKDKIDKTKIRVDNFRFKVTGKMADLDKLTASLKKSFEKLSEINERIVSH